MAEYTLTIYIKESPANLESSAEEAYEEIVGSIEDARDSGELGDCDVSWGELQEIKKTSDLA